MQKPTKYDWKDSNMALFGSDDDRKVKKESAQSEPAWEGAGADVGVEVWRIVKFQVEKWPVEQQGEFFNGDSYIILNTYKDEGEDALKYDLHFWIGKYSTQDEYGTAAYKTVELDTLLDDKPVQHRETQGHETSMFKSYFKGITLMKGGADTGFNRVLPEAYTPRMHHVKKVGRGKFETKEVSLKKANLTSEDVFIIDHGKKVYQWNGKNCSADEKLDACRFMDGIQAVRPNVITETLDESSTSSKHPALMILGDGEKKVKAEEPVGVPAMLKISDGEEPGRVKMDEVEGGISKDALNTNDVFIINTGEHVFCWVGAGASIDERKNGIPYACNYLGKTETPWLPITVVGEGKETAAFNAIF